MGFRLKCRDVILPVPTFEKNAILSNDKPSSYLSRFLDIGLPSGGYAMALAEAYFDESGTHSGSKVVCVAGYIFKKERALDIEYEWNLMLKDYDIKVFHMRECAHRIGGFAHLSKAETIEAARRAIKLIKKHAERGIAFSVDVESFDLIPLFGRNHNPYSFMCTQVMHSIKRWATEEAFGEDVTYIFESGAAGKGYVMQSFDEIEAEPNLKKAFRFDSVQFVSKDKAVLLQCADMLAWHWNLFRNKKIRGENPWRADFKSLKEKLIDPRHYDKASIVRWLRADRNPLQFIDKNKPA